MSQSETGLVFIDVPENYRGSVGDLMIDPTIRLPLIVGEAGVPAPADIEWEMILAGMLRLLALEPDHRDGDYYRRFVQAARPRIVEELAETGVISARNGSFDTAEEIFSALAGVAPERIEGPSNLAATLAQRAEVAERHDDADRAEADRERAAAIYAELLARDDSPAEVFFNAGLFSLSVHDYARARDRLQSFVAQTTPDDPEADEIEIDDERLTEARRLLAHLNTHHLTDDQFKQAYDFIRMGEEERGIEAISGFLEGHPDTWNAWFLLGWAHRRQGRFEEAGIAFERALALGGNNADTLNELAICRLEEGRLDESHALLEQALRDEPDNTKIMSNFGVLALRADDPEEARRFFETVHALDPDDPVAVRYLDEIEQMGY